MARLIALTMLCAPLIATAADVRCVVTRENPERELVFDQVVFSDVVRGPRSMLVRRDGVVTENFDPERDLPLLAKKTSAKRFKADMTGAVSVTLTPHDRSLSIATAHFDTSQAPGARGQRTDAIAVGDPSRMLHLFDGANRLAVYCGSEN